MIIAAFYFCFLPSEKASVRAGKFALKLFPEPVAFGHNVRSKTGAAFMPDTK